MKRFLLVLISIIVTVMIVGLTIYIYLDSRDFLYYHDAVYPLMNVADDGAEYTFVRCGPNANYIITDADALMDHKYDVVYLYHPSLENTTGDGYYRLYKNGEFVCGGAFYSCEFFDFFLTWRVKTYTEDEWDAYMQEHIW